MTSAPITTDLISRLRSDLAAAHFSVPGLTGLWGIDADAALRRNQRVPAQRALAALATRLGRNEPAATLARLFLLGDQVPRADLDTAMPTLGAKGAEELALVAFVGNPTATYSAGPETFLRPLVDLRPYSFVDAHGAGSWWIVSDLGELALGHPLGETHVLGIGGASRTLSGLMMPTPVARALDIGTGCGIQAMHAARHAEHVVATDISVRALELAALNAELNDIDNIEFRFGSLFEPVAGERFDHIISNPPFVITPRGADVPSYEYRDGGMVGDALVEAVVRGAAAHLSPGGVVQLLGNWEYHDDTDAFDRLERWLTPVAGESLDAWIIEREVQSPGEYAETWIRDGGTRPGTADFDLLYNAWLNDFEARGVRRVGFGYLVLRRTDVVATGLPTPPILRRLERMPDALGHNPAGLGAHLAECLAAHDRLARTDDALLLRTSLTVASDVTEERHYWPGQPNPTLMTLHQGGGFGRSVPLDTALAGLVGACDGDLAVGAIIGALAQLLEADEAALVAELLPQLRGLLVDGFLSLPEPV